MTILEVYAHPSKDSFTYRVREAFEKGAQEEGHTLLVSDLYEMGFLPVFTEEEYRREAFYRADRMIPEDVQREQEKIRRADAIVFIYPVFWTEAPAILTGWFQRVWTFGFAYGNGCTMPLFKRASFLVTMGGSSKDPVRMEQIEAMKTVMIKDRIHDRAEECRMVVFDEMTRGYGNDENRKEREERFVREAYEIGRHCGESIRQ